MGRDTTIGWTQSTWNPWVGCTRVSPGCAYCYMFREQERYGREPRVVQRTRTTFDAPRRWTTPRRIFTCSWSDWFHADADAWRAEAWAIIRETPWHQYQILTKRPDRIREQLPSDWGDGYPNVWLGVSAENQRMAEKRIPLLLDIPAAVRWISAEPLLGPVDVTRWLRRMLDWVVVGGESGSDRTMQLEWLERIVDDCRDANVPVFVKQDSGPIAGRQGRIADAYWVQQWPTDVPSIVRQDERR